MLIRISEFGCAPRNVRAIISGRMKDHWISGVLLIIFMIGMTPASKKPSPAKKSGDASAFTAAKKNATVTINGRTWRQEELRPAWVSSRKPARHTPNPATQTHGPQSQADQVSSPRQSH